MKLSQKFNKINIFTLILISASVFLFVWLGIKNYPFQGQYKINMELGSDTSLITKLGPPPRVALENDYQKIFEGPVYFDVRTLPWYTKIQIYIVYKNGEQVFDNMGIQTALGFNYKVVEPTFFNNEEVEYEKAMVEFNLADGYQDKNFSRFLISVTQGDEENKNPLHIKSIKVILIK